MTKETKTNQKSQDAPAEKKNIRQVLDENGLVVVKRDEIENQALSKSVATEVFNPVTWAQFREMATTFIKSGALPKDTNAEQLIVKMQSGFEMGMKPFEAIRSLYIVNGMIAIGGRDLIHQLRKHGWAIEYFDESDDSVSMRVTKDGVSYEETFTFEEADKSGWTKAYGKLKPGWLEGANRNLKLRYGVASKLVKSYLPEVMGSAVDVKEIAEDTIPVINGQETQEISPEDWDRINSAESFEELTEVTRSLQGKYKVRVLKQAYDARKEELENKQ